MPQNLREEFDVVFSHNDFSENSALISRSEYTKIYLTDLEQCSLNIRGVDLAALFNEAMITYQSQGEQPVKVYYDWMMGEAELENIAKIYLTHYHGKYYQYGKDLEEFLTEEVPILIDQIKRCVLLSDAVWAFGALSSSPVNEESPEDAADSYDFFWTRLEMLQKTKEKFLGEHLGSLALE